MSPRSLGNSQCEKCEVYRKELNEFSLILNKTVLRVHKTQLQFRREVHALCYERLGFINRFNVIEGNFCYRLLFISVKN